MNMKKKNTSITPQYYEFLKLVAANNNREWFQAHKEVFNEEVYEPFKSLTEEVIGLMQQEDPQIQIDFKQAAFRFYRDTRFSVDKSPYKLWMGAVVNRVGRKNTRYPELYFQFGPGENFIATGLYRPDKETLNTIRTAIAQNPDAFKAVITDKAVYEFFPEGFQGDKNKRLPHKDWMQLAKDCPYILNKQFYTIRYYTPQDIMRPGLAAFIVAHYRALEKFNQWLLGLY